MLFSRKPADLPTADEGPARAAEPHPTADKHFVNDRP
jgi:hypothetical protein